MDYRDINIGKLDQFPESTLIGITLEGKQYLIVRIGGRIYAADGLCTHYGAPLEEGILSGENVICPWHHSCFNVRSGGLIEPPALNALNKFDVIIEEEDVYLRVPDVAPEPRIPEMARTDASRDTRTFVIIGAGAAGNMAAQTLREDGYKGRILMITYENTGPYDRPNLSKEYLAGVAPDEWMPLRTKEFYDQFGIEILMGRKVTLADTSEKSVTMDDGSVIKYDKLLLASGSAPRRLQVPGDDFPNIFYLRTFHDADRIIEATENARKVAIVGSSFIGLETAVSLRKRKLSVTVVTPEKVPFQKVFGTEIGGLFLEAHKKNSVDFRLDSGVERFEGSLKAENVVLTSGEKLDVDFVLVGIGVRPAAEFVKGVVFAEDGGIRVDQYFRASEDVFAAGDIASYPEWRSGEIIRTEHWRTAEQQGRCAAHNMTGKVTSNTFVPFFWTHQAGLEIRYAGYVRQWDDIIINGDIKEKDFIAYYVKNNQIYAAAGNKRDREMAAIEELMRLERMPPADVVRNSRPDLLKILKDALSESRI